MILDADEKILKESDNIWRFKHACEVIIPAWCDRIVENLEGNDYKGKVCGSSELSLPMHKYAGLVPFIKYSDSKGVYMKIYMKILVEFRTYEEAVNSTFDKLMRVYPAKIKKGLIKLLPLEDFREDKFDYKHAETTW